MDSVDKYHRSLEKWHEDGVSDREKERRKDLVWYHLGAAQSVVLDAVAESIFQKGLSVTEQEAAIKRYNSHCEEYYEKWWDSKGARDNLAAKREAVAARLEAAGLVQADHAKDQGNREQ